MKETAVVILNWNGKKFIQKFLPSVITHNDGYRIIVADNDSTDDSVAFLQENFPSVEILQMDKNRGFSGGYNEALKQVKADNYVLLNSDVEVTKNWTKAPLKLLEEENVVACQPKIRAYDRKGELEHAGAAGGFIDKWGYPFCRGRLFNETELDKGQYDDEKEIFWATGACLFITSKAYHDMGGFNDDFFAHMEEIDLCWRLKNAGKKIYYTPESVVYHVGGGTLDRSNPRKTFLNFRNGLALIYINLPGGKRYSVLIWRMILDAVAATFFLLSRKPKDFWAVFRAHISFYRMLSTWQKSRNKAKKAAVNYQHQEIYKGSIVWDFFVKKKKKFSALKF